MSKTRSAGICSMVLGIVLLTYGGYRVGKRIDWAADYVYGVYALEHDLIMGEPAQRGHDEKRYVLDSLYIGCAGFAAFLAGGIGAVVSRERIGAPDKEAGYAGVPRKGSPENPFRL